MYYAHTVLYMSSIELSGTAIHYLAEWEWEGARGIQRGSKEGKEYQLCVCVCVCVRACIPSSFECALCETSRDSAAVEPK